MTITAPETTTKIDAARTETKTMLAGITDDLELVKAARKIKDAHQDLYDNVGAYRDSLMLSLVLHDGWDAVAAAKAGGVSRSWIGKVMDARLSDDGRFKLAPYADAAARKQLARARGVRKYANAETELPGIIEQLAVSAARAEVAREAQTAAIRRLMEAGGITQAQIAQDAGMNRTNVSHIMNPRINGKSASATAAAASVA